MAERYAVSAGNWVAARFDGGTLPGVGDTVHANGFAVTINTSITVDALSTRVGAVAAAGGSFTTSGTVTVNADSYAGTTTCLTLAANGTQNGDSYGSNTTNSTTGTIVEYLAVQNGDATGGTGFIRTGSTVRNGGILNGNTLGGSGDATAYGAILSFNAKQNGNASGGVAAAGTLGQTRSVLTGNSFGGAATGIVGFLASQGCIHTGNSFGGGGTNAHGSSLSGCFHIGNSTGGLGSSAFGTMATNGSIQQGTQTGNPTNATNGFGTFLQTGSIAITSGITTAASAGLRIENGTVVLLTNGVTAGQVSTTGATVGRYIISDSLPEYAFIGSGAVAGFTGIRGTHRTLGT